MTPEGNAIVYCEGAFDTPQGKTAHGLVRFTRRYRVLSVVDSCCAGRDAGQVLDGTPRRIPVHAALEDAVEAARTRGPATHLVIGIAPDGGGLPPEARKAVLRAVDLGLHIDSGLHDFISEDPEIGPLAEKNRVLIRDIRKPPPKSRLHFFSGKIEKVKALKIAVLGTDSAVGKRTTAWRMIESFETAGIRADLVGTGQTAWMQGVRHGLILDSLVNDFVSGEIEHAVWCAWNESRPEVIVIEGQGSLMNPAYPGGFEILAAGRPDLVVLQHAPARRDYDGFPGYPIQPLAQQIRIIEELSGKRVAAVTINHEDLKRDEVPPICSAIRSVTGVPTFDVLLEGAEGLVKVLIRYLQKE